jgi:hypothetical protein
MIKTGDIMHYTKNGFNEGVYTVFYLVVKRTSKTIVLQELGCHDEADQSRNEHFTELLSTPILTETRREPFRCKIRISKWDGSEYVQLGNTIIHLWDGKPVETWRN